MDLRSSVMIEASVVAIVDEDGGGGSEFLRSWW